MIEAASGCIEGTCAGKYLIYFYFSECRVDFPLHVCDIYSEPTKQLEGFAGLFVTINSISNCGYEQKPSFPPKHISPKSVSSFADSNFEPGAVLVYNCQKRQRSDAIVEVSSAQSGFLARSCRSMGPSSKEAPAVAREEMLKPRAIYPDNFKHPKMNHPPSSECFKDLKIPVFDWNRLRASSDSSHRSTMLFNKGSVHTSYADKIGETRRISQQRSRTNNCNSHWSYERNTPSSDYGGRQQSQLALDLERVSLADTPFSPFSPSHSRLLRHRTPVVPVMFSPIQPDCTRLDTALAGSSNEEDEVEDQAQLCLSCTANSSLEDAGSTAAFRIPLSTSSTNPALTLTPFLPLY